MDSHPSMTIQDDVLTGAGCIRVTCHRWTYRTSGDTYIAVIDWRRGAPLCIHVFDCEMRAIAVCRDPAVLAWAVNPDRHAIDPTRLASLTRSIRNAVFSKEFIHD